MTRKEHLNRSALTRWCRLFGESSLSRSPPGKLKFAWALGHKSTPDPAPREGRYEPNVVEDTLRRVVRVAGVEPALLSELDFESSASTNSTTPAQVQRGLIYKAKARVSTDVMSHRHPCDLTRNRQRGGAPDIPSFKW